MQNKEKRIQRISEATIPTKHGNFLAVAYKSLIDGVEHIALVKGDVYKEPNILARVHSECVTGDVFGSKRCDCGDQLDKALEMIARVGKGVLVYLRDHEGRGIGIGQKLQAYQLQEKGYDTVQANIELGFAVDLRDYGIGAEILLDLGLISIKLMTNNPEKCKKLAEYGLNIVERVPIPTIVTKENKRYLMTKKQKMGHLLDIEE